MGFVLASSSIVADNADRKVGAGKDSLRMTGVGAFLGGPTTIEGRISLLGKAAPSFQLAGEDGKKVSLRRLTLRGPLLMHFYRGNW